MWEETVYQFQNLICATIIETYAGIKANACH